MSSSPDRRVALVTGAADGIGRAIALRLADNGMSIGAVDRDEASLRRTCRYIESAGGDAYPAVANLARSEEREQAVAAVVEELGEIVLLVNNAANHGERHSFLDVSSQEWEEVLATNLTAAAHLAQQTLPAMVRRGKGCIINILAIQAELPLPSYATYIASKGGLDALTRALAAEFSPRGVRVNAVVPGAIATASAERALGLPSGSEASAATERPATLLGRMGLPVEVAAAVAFLASDDASFITGAFLHVDGGRRISRRTEPFSRFDAVLGSGAEPSRSGGGGTSAVDAQQR